MTPLNLAMHVIPTKTIMNRTVTLRTMMAIALPVVPLSPSPTSKLYTASPSSFLSVRELWPALISSLALLMVNVASYSYSDSMDRGVHYNSGFCYLPSKFLSDASRLICRDANLPRLSIFQLWTVLQFKAYTHNVQKMQSRGRFPSLLMCQGLL